MSLINNRVDTITDEARDAIFQCTLCGGCDMACKFSTDIEILEGLYALRAESFKRTGPLPGHKKVLNRMEDVGHPIFEDGKKGDWLKEAGLTPGMEGKDTLLFVGDRYALLKERRQTLLNLVELLNMGGISFGLLGDEEPSTGRQVLDIGDQERFNRYAEQTTTAIKRSGAKTVICADALDFNAFRAHLPKASRLNGVKMVHAVEVLCNLVKKKKIKPRKKYPARVAYHDPCSLGRLSEPYIGWEGVRKKVMQQLVIYDPPRPVNRGTSGCYEPPRRILRSIPGMELVEFYRRREYAFCCGGEGMAYAAGYTEFVNNTALRRMEEAKAIGADIVATACPNCDTNLGDVTEKVGIPVKNVIDLLAESVRE
jgi:Fe-S oxidoreductase